MYRLMARCGVCTAQRNLCGFLYRTGSRPPLFCRYCEVLRICDYSVYVFRHHTEYLEFMDLSTLFLLHFTEGGSALARFISWTVNERPGIARCSFFFILRVEKTKEVHFSQFLPIWLMRTGKVARSRVRFFRLECTNTTAWW